jgi:hypothetical protein
MELDSSVSASLINPIARKKNCVRVCVYVCMCVCVQSLFLKGRYVTSLASKC